MKRKISFALAILMVLSVIMGSGLTMPVFAADSGLEWAFWSTQPEPIVENISGENVTGTGVTSIIINGEFTNYITPASSAVTTNSAYADAITNLIDRNTDSKFCTSTSPTFPTLVIFRFNAPITPTAYYINGANDDNNYGRAPSQWTIYGTNNASETVSNFNAANWTQLDYQNNNFVTANFQQRAFSFTNTTAYQYFAIRVTGRQSGSNFPQSQTTTSGQTQFSDFGFCESITVKGFGGTTNYLYPTVVANPGAMTDGAATPWNGPNVLCVNGKTGGSGSGTVSASSYTTIRKGLNIEVFPDTKLSYCINPQCSTSSYDYNLTSAHSAIDLKFSDGTYLRNLGAKDIYGYDMSPLGQGKAKVSHMNSWNYVESEIGKVAAGKTIVEIIAGFEMPAAPKNTTIRADFDDLKIFRRDDASIIANTELADYTDVRFGTRVGSYGNGACSPLVGTPNPFNYWVPCTSTDDRTPYNSQGRAINYIRISHIASRWFGEVGTLTFRPDATSSSNRTTGSGFIKDNETAHSYYYSVKFNDNDAVNPGVKLEVTPMPHSAVLRFTFPANAQRRSVQIAGFGATPTVSGKTFTGRDTTNSYGLKSMSAYGEFNVTPSSTSPSSSYLLVNFTANPTGPNGETIVELKVATSFMSTSQAQRNLQLEVEDSEWFDAVKAKSMAIWNKVLSAAKIEDNTANYWDLVDFYSKFARSTMYPTIMHENTNPGTIADANANPKWQFVSPYRTSTTVIRDGYFSYNEGFWDTFRTKWTMLAFFRPADAGALFDGVVNHFKDQDSRGSFGIPRWIKPAGQDLMVMTSSDVIATEMYARNVPYDYYTGYDAALKSSSVYSSGGDKGGRHGTQESMFKGYTPWGSASPAGGGGQLDTSWALEGFVNDAGLAKMAKGLSEEKTKAGDAFAAKQYNDEYVYFNNRAKFYTNIFDPNSNGNVGSLGWMRNKNRAGQWLGGGSGSATTTFNAKDWGWGYCEDNAYNYVLTVPQDGKGLANLFGGKAAFGKKMEHIFADSTWVGSAPQGAYGGGIHEGFEKREVKIGEWGLSNEPAEHMMSMWLFTDKPENAALYTRLGMYRAGGSIQVGRGMMGEEDNGAMASWWVWAYLGMFPLDNGSGNVVLGSPRFKKVTFTLDDGRSFVFNAPNASAQNCYVNGVKINGVPYNKLYFTQDLFADGNVFEFDMSSTPSGWASTAQVPPSLTETGDGAEFGPDILMDVTFDSIPLASSVANLPTAAGTTGSSVYATNITMGAWNSSLTNAARTSGNAVNLFDDISANTPNRDNGGAKNTSDAQFSARTSEITYYSSIPVKVELYTMTSSNTQGADPKTWTLHASNDGTTWVELDSRSLPNITTVTNSAVTTAADQATRTDETFRWRLQTKPFAIDKQKQGSYKYYQIRITDSSSTANLRLAEVEFLADQFYKVNKDSLLIAINAAKAVKAEQELNPIYGAAEYNALLPILADAIVVYDNPNAVGREINGATSKLNGALNLLIKLQKAYERFMAIDETANNNRVTITGGARKDSATATPGSATSSNWLAAIPEADRAQNLPITGTSSFYPLANTVPGSIASYKYIDFGNGDRLYTEVSAIYCGIAGTVTNGGKVFVRLDSPTGEIIATIDAQPTASSGWSCFAYGRGSVKTPNIRGVHTVYFEFGNNNAEYAGNFHSFQFDSVQSTPYALVQRSKNESTDPPYAVISPVYDLLNGDATELNVLVYTATFDATSNKLVSLAEVPMTIPANSRAAISPVSVASAGNNVKLFVWKANSFVPVVTERELN